MGGGVRLVDSAEETAQRGRVVAQTGLDREKKRQGRTQFLCHGRPRSFYQSGKTFSGEKVESAVRIER